jgi:selenide,water dikinase
MRGISVPYDGNVIVGMDMNDDAGVYRLTDDIALIQTIDYITPIVDDPFTYGQIAACNSLSDIYAMGGRPLTALNVVCFPTKKFSLDRLSDILRGGLSVIQQAGAQLLGGHSVEDDEMKYGLSVTGIVHPDRVLENNGLKAGDAIILTKPLGTGIVATAVKAGSAEDEVLKPFITSMSTLNDKAAHVMLGYDVHACTDVTGFGLMGHLREMLGNDPLEIVVESKELPLLPGALHKASLGLIPGGMYRNRDFIGDLCTVGEGVPPELADILFDPQTSGGLLIGLSEADAPDLLSEMHAQGISEARIVARVRDSVLQKIVVLR